MNREMKFRGKEKCSGLWRCGFLLFDGEKYYIIQTIQGTLVKWIVDTNTIGQFTSLYDKNGKEIYEGDILKAGDARSWIEVRFVRGVFAFLWNGNLDDECPTQSPTTEWAEVIGNIHDNLYLMK